MYQPQHPYNTIEDLERRRARLRALDAEFAQQGGAATQPYSQRAEAGTQASQPRPTALDELTAYADDDDDYPSEVAPRPPTPMASGSRELGGQLQSTATPPPFTVLRFTTDGPTVFSYDPLLAITTTPSEPPLYLQCGSLRLYLQWGSLRL